MTLLRLAWILAALVILAGATIVIVPIEQRAQEQRQVQELVDVIDRAAGIATQPQPLQGGYAIGGASVQLTTGGATLARGLALGGAAPLTLATYKIGIAFGVWVKPAGGVFNPVAFPATVVIDSAKQIAVVSGTPSSLAAFPPPCDHLAIGFPAGATPPIDATYISCATGTVEQSVQP
ncbi:hypothetical protein EPN42_03640 [bacterium]|nr:MAG: hypothetical protein EPN42_03640 [bacterium]